MEVIDGPSSPPPVSDLRLDFRLSTTLFSVSITSSVTIVPPTAIPQPVAKEVMTCTREQVFPE